MTAYTCRLRGETLEDRRLLSLTPAITSITWLGQEIDAFEDQWVIGFANDSAAQALMGDSTLGGLGGGSLYMLRTGSPVGLLEAPQMSPEQILAWAAGLSGVSYVEPNMVLSLESIPPNDPVFAMESTKDGLWGLRNQGQDQIQWNGSSFVGTGATGTSGADIKAFDAWQTTTGARDVVVGVIDTGVDYAHPDLYKNIWLNQGEIPDSIMSQLTDVDEDGQITFIDLNDSENASIIQVTDRTNDGSWNNYIDAGDLLNDPDWENHFDDDHNGYEDDLIGWNSIYNTNDPMDDHLHGTHVAGTIGAVGDNGVGVAGVNWEVLIVPLKIFDADGHMSVAAATEAIDYATLLRRDLDVNLVATNNSWGGGEFSQALKDSIDDAGTEDVLFIAAAGNNFFLDNDVLPNYPSSFASDNIIAVAATDSNDGLASFSHYGLTSVDLGAPGVNTLSTFPTMMTSLMSSLGFTTFYETISGTSMAAPHVTGMVALLASINGAHSPAAEVVKQTILSTVDAVSSLSGKTVTGGRLNANAAVDAFETSQVLVVSTLTDENDTNYSFGDLSLREALHLGTSDITLIKFDPSLFGGTITLSSSLGSLDVDENVILDGPRADLLTINGAGITGVFAIGSGVEATIRGLTITGGSGGSAYGTGINSLAAALTLEGVLIEGNEGDGSGGIYQSGGSISIKNSTIADNLGQYYAGGVYLNSTTATIVNSTISGNTTYYNGGGVNAQYSQVEITNSTITANSANGYGGGVYTYGGSVTVKNTIIAGNYDGSSANDVSGTLHSSSSYNLIGTGGSGGLSNGVNGNLVGVSNPGLAELADNGGPTPTHALLITSPAIDAGNPAASGLPAYDQRGTGFSRVLDGPDSGVTARLDIGSFEWAKPHLLEVDTLADENDGNWGTGDFSLREALALAAALAGEDTIMFDSALFAAGPGTIVVDDGLGELVIDSTVEINGPGADLLTIDGDDQTRVFHVTSSGETILSGLTIEHGYASDGGGIYAEGFLALDSVAISDNYASSRGGGIHAAGTYLDIVNSTIDNNTGYHGGGIFADTDYFSLRNSTVSGNEGFTGAGLWLYDSLHEYQYSSPNLASIDQCTITANDGFGISLGEDVYLQLYSSIVAGNSSDNISGSVTSASYNLIGNLGTGGIQDGVNGNIVLESWESPGLAALGNYGGRTKTHALLSTSQAIDAGNPTSLAGSGGPMFQFDQRGPGFTRVVDGDGNAVARADIGAFEFAAPIVVSTLADENDGRYGLGDLSLREAILLADSLSGANSIRFDPELFTAGPGTIALAYDGPDSGTAKDPLTIDSDVTIEGPGAALLTIDGEGVSGIIHIESGVEAAIGGLTITGGDGGSAYGTAIDSYADELTLDGVLIEDNTGYGSGGIYQSGGRITIKNSTIADNLGQYYSGGVYLSSTIATIVNSTISGNTTYNNGGGVHSEYSTILITNSTITENSADGYGGGAYLKDGDTTINNSTIDNNGGYQGGGLYLSGGSLGLTGSTVSSNSSYNDGGGIALLGDSAYVSLYHNTITLNTSSSGDGGGLMIGEEHTYNVLGHNIIADNSASGDDNIGGTVGWGGGYYNLLGNQGTGGLSNGVDGNIVLGASANAGLAPLGDYGGPTRTHALKTGSVAMDSGDSNAVAGSGGIPLYDQRGKNRIVDGDGTSGARIDIGAFESGNSFDLVVTTVSDENDSLITADFAADLSLREALALAAVLPGANVIKFDSSLTASGPATITLSYDGPDSDTTPDQLLIDSSSAIEGPAANLLTIDGNSVTRVFQVNSGVSATIQRLSILDGNSSVGGGGIYTQGNLTLDAVQISGGFSSTAGGGIYMAGGSLYVLGSTIYDNDAYQGGGIYIDAGTFEMHGSTVSGNSSYSDGGGIAVLGNPSGMSVYITHSTIAFNSSVSGSGGGIAIVEDQQYIAMHHTIVADNTASTDDNISGDVHYGGEYNLIGYDGRGGLDSYSSTNIILGSSQTAGLAALDYYGGMTKTHALLNGSQAIDAGDPDAEAGQGGIPDYDQRGSDRVDDGDDDEDPIIDIGAFELAADEYFGSL
ncbi:MAG: choice-of-anchor Q domain-containing protein [Pirellulales bacterium]